MRVFTVSDVLQETGLTHRQLDRAARIGALEPSIASGKGRGSRRLYSSEDVAVLQLMCRLCEIGFTWKVAGCVATRLRQSGHLADLAGLAGHVLVVGADFTEVVAFADVVKLLHGDFAPLTLLSLEELDKYR